MKYKLVLALILLVLAAIAGLIFYKLNMLDQGGSLRSGSGSNTITVTDALGREIELPYPVEKVVVTDDEVAELVQLIGAADKVVGIEPSIKTRGYFPLMADKPITGSQFRGLNYELIAKLQPDVVILMDVGPVGKIIDKLDKIGVKSIVISIKPQNIPETIRLLGKIFGKEKRAEELLQWWFSKWEFLEEKLKDIKDKPKLKVFVGMGFHPTNKLPTRTWGKLAKWNYILEKLNMENIASAKLDKSGQLDLEYIVEANPDIILIGDWSDNWLGYTKNNSSLARKIVENVLNDPVLQSVNAVKNHKVFLIHYVMLGSFRSVIGAYYLAKIAYPELMKDVDPEEINKEYFEHWLGVPYKGIWFYPKPWLGENP